MFLDNPDGAIGRKVTGAFGRAALREFDPDPCSTTPLPGGAIVAHRPAD